MRIVFLRRVNTVTDLDKMLLKFYVKLLLWLCLFAFFLFVLMIGFIHYLF